MIKLNTLFDNNLKWATSVKQQDPSFFSRLARQQKPEILWVGCSDSRVPANTIVDLPPGEIFVHRNIANVVVHTDLNCLSVIQFAVEVLKINHIVICGHYGCSGIKAALNGEQYGLVDNWLRHVRDVARFHAERFSGLKKDEQLKLLCELNVREQVTNICNTSIVQAAWGKGRDLCVHGWIYDVEDGLLNGLCTRHAPGDPAAEVP